MFVSASVGFCCLVAIIRPLRSEPHMGNFYLDSGDSSHIRLPGCSGNGRAAAGGWHSHDARRQREGCHRQTGRDGPDESGRPQLQQEIARGPVAAILPIKHLGTNGGGSSGPIRRTPSRTPVRGATFSAL